MYRDEADAIQSVFGKRLMPLAEGATCFTAAQLQAAIDKLKTDEYLPGGIGAVSIENPVRRTDGGLVPIGELRAISALCRARGIPLHLDGARLFMASAWSGVPVQEYAALFDTVYISLYKYLGAGAGAVLCGPKALIDKMPHLVKIHGGNQFSNWMNAAMALHRLEGFGERLRAAIAASETVFAALNKMPGIRVAPVPGGTNIYHLQLGKGVDVQRLRETLNKEHRIRLAPADASNRIALTVNETILYQTPEAIIAA
ncbi:MAG: threonine aldolase, partial [Sphingobacteriales bacterium]